MFYDFVYLVSISDVERNCFRAWVVQKAQNCFLTFHIREFDTLFVQDGSISFPIGLDFYVYRTVSVAKDKIGLSERAAVGSVDVSLMIDKIKFIGRREQMYDF